jgi:hypothetical protein
MDTTTVRTVWEYKLEPLDLHFHADAELTLNQLGAEGWELVSIGPNTDPLCSEKEVGLFKRPSA